MLLASDVVESVEFASKVSLLDYDIILFRPDLTDFIGLYGTVSRYKGKPCLSEVKSFELREACEHWRREIKEAIEIGKTVIVHLCEPEEFYVQTGRNRTSISAVEWFTNYHSLPIELDWTAAQGREVVLRAEHRQILSTYWDRFCSWSIYQVTLIDAENNACLVTRNGGKSVGLHFRATFGEGGNLFLLPDINFDDDAWFEEDQNEEGYLPFTKAAEQFAASYITEIVALDHSLKLGLERTAEPEWAKGPSYAMTAERRVHGELLLAEEALERAQRKKEELKTELIEVGMLRGLLYETGKPLEAVVLKALQILGFEAENFEDESNEFDAVFMSSEGRLLGEVEGKDNKPINITKLRQLTMNIEEDFERDEVETRAKGVLFGNAYRLTEPAERDTPFTEKCIASASAQSIALVHTPELFNVARHVLERDDNAFATLCREVLIGSSGLVVFPAVPHPPTPPNPSPPSAPARPAPACSGRATDR